MKRNVFFSLFLMDICSTLKANNVNKGDVVDP